MFVKGTDTKDNNSRDFEANLPMPMILHGVERDLSFSIPKKERSIHSCYELSYLRTGKIEFDFGNTQCVINQGGTIIIKPDVPHRLKVLDESCEAITIYFDFLNQETLDDEIRDSRSKECFDEFLAYALEKNEEDINYGKHPYLIIRGKGKERISDIGDTIVREVKEDKFGSKMMCRALATQLLVLAARAIHQEWEESLKIQRRKVGELLEIAKEYIHEHYAEPLTVSDIAQYVFMSVGYFSKMFTIEESMSPMNYITNLRITKAKDLLENEKLKISDIANIVGFSTIQSFNRIFKRNVDMTPLEYRRRFGRG